MVYPGIRFRDEGDDDEDERFREFAFKSDELSIYENEILPYTMKVELEDW